MRHLDRAASHHPLGRGKGRRTTQRMPRTAFEKWAAGRIPKPEGALAPLQTRRGIIHLDLTVAGIRSASPAKSLSLKRNQVLISYGPMFLAERDSAMSHGVEAGVSRPSFMRRKLFVYISILIILLAFGSPSGGLFDIPISFLLKNKLQLNANEVAMFRLLAAMPLYLSFVFGFLRDTWNPFGMSDRGFMLLFGCINAVFYILFAFSPISYMMLLVAVLTSTTSFLFVLSAQNGLTASIGLQHAMTGQISAVWNTVLSIAMVASLLVGGALSGFLEEKGADQAVRILFLIGAAIMVVVAAYSIWKPKEVFGTVIEQASDQHLFCSLRTLARHWPIYPALLIWALWNFAPGSSTPLQYYLQDTLQASDAQWGEWNAIFAASFIPAFAAYGILCRKVALKTTLLWGTVAAVPQMVPLVFIHSMTGALIAAAPIGLMGGIATGAYLDLIIRSCPRGLQGTTLMLANSLYFAVTRFGDVLGTKLYDYYGSFESCVLAITLVYALILPALLLVPAHITASSDRQTS
jgi:MFS family permease